MNKKLKISSYQKQIIIGKILGDGHLETVNGHTFRLRIEHSFKQKGYVDWLYQRIKNLAASPPRLKVKKLDNKIYNNYWFDTSYSSSFRFYYQQFYQGGRKVVPNLINRWLTRLVLAIWFMDDGSRKSAKHQAKIINTQAFGKTSLKRLQDALRKNFNIQTKLRKQKEGWQIYILATESKKFKNLLKEYILPSFFYKLD